MNILKGFFPAIESQYCPGFDFDRANAYLCVGVCVCVWLFRYHFSFNWNVQRSRWTDFTELFSFTFNFQWSNDLTSSFLLLTEYTDVCIVHSIGHTVYSYLMIIIIKLKWKEEKTKRKESFWCLHISTWASKIFSCFDNEVLCLVWLWNGKHAPRVTKQTQHESRFYIWDVHFYIQLLIASFSSLF